MSVIKIVLKSVKSSFLYLGTVLVIILWGLLRPKGLIYQMSIGFRNDVIFWSVMSIIFILFIALCIYEVVCDINRAVREYNNGDSIKTRDYIPVPKRINDIPMTREEHSFLDNLIYCGDRSRQIAVALVLKDFVEERNSTICSGELSVYIPSYTNIREDTRSSLTSLVSVMNLISTYPNDKYYNPALIRNII